jgi:hypothetical protein
MVRTRKTATPPLHDEIKTVDSDTDWPSTPSTVAAADKKRPKCAGMPYFENTKANVKNITGPNEICWEKEYGERYILCWMNPETIPHKDVQLIVIGKIKSADLEMPNQYGTYTIQLHIDEEVRQCFDAIWKTGKWVNSPGCTLPISNEGVAKFSTKLTTINKEAREDALDQVLTENDPFPGLHDGRPMHADSAALMPYPAHKFTEGTTVAVEATVATYNFKNDDGYRKFGYALSIREVYWLRDYQPDSEHINESGNSRNPTSPNKKRRSGNDLVSPRSFKRKDRKATFDPSPPILG